MLDDPAIVRPDTGRLWLASPNLQCCTGSFAARQEPRPPNSGNVRLEYYDWLLSRPRYPKRLPQSSFRPRIAHGDLDRLLVSPRNARFFSGFAWDSKARYNDRQGAQMLTEAARRRDEMMADPGLGSSHEEVWKRISDLRNG